MTRRASLTPHPFRNSRILRLVDGDRWVAAEIHGDHPADALTYAAATLRIEIIQRQLVDIADDAFARGLAEAWKR